jgi:hypothetical protein
MNSVTCNGKEGQRVRLIATCNPNTKVKPGYTGTIWHVVPSNGTLRVKWDCNAKLDLNPGEDEWEILES